MNRGTTAPVYALVRRRRIGQSDLADLIAEEVQPTQDAVAPSDDRPGRSFVDTGTVSPTDVPVAATLDDDGDLVRSYGFGAFDSDGSPIVWPAGHRITVALDPSGMAYPHFVRDAAHAIKKLNFVGAFTLRLISHDGGRLDEADIVIRWDSNPSPSGPGLDGRVAETTVTTTGAAGCRTISKAVVRLSVRTRQPEGFVSGGWGVTLLHELMHALGAGHCNDPKQVMFPRTGAVADLGVGDRYCLRMLAEAARQRAGAGA